MDPHGSSPFGPLFSSLGVPPATCSLGVVDVLSSCPEVTGKGKEMAGTGVVDVLSSCPEVTGKGKEMAGTEKIKKVKEILSQLNLEKYADTKLSLRDVLETGLEDERSLNCLTLQDVPWRFLSKLLALNVTARDTSLKSIPADEHRDIEDCEKNNECTFDGDNLPSHSVNPLDVLCVLLYCSDSFLQQEILLKMSTCQFAVPLLLPPSDGTKCTLMLWAMRDMVRKWRPHSLRESRGFREESLVLIPMPTISFVRLGSCSLSKSRILNAILSPPQQHHDFFIHREMECGNVPRRLSDGLVEISWYFPGGREKSDIFPEPVAFTNLRGDIESHQLQFRFLTAVSSAVFIYIEDLGEREYKLLSDLKSGTKCYFIISSNEDKSKKSLNIITRLIRDLKISQSQILKKNRAINDAQFMLNLQSAILPLIKLSPTSVSVEGMADTARKQEIYVDEDCEQCKRGKDYAREITKDIQDIMGYKKEMMKLQGEPWKELAKTEKEYCRLKEQGKTNIEDYKSQLQMKILKLRREQNSFQLTDGLTKFISGIGFDSFEEKHYFLKWMKCELDSLARNSLCNLRDKYQKKLNNCNTDPKELAELDKIISGSSIGIEHFMREMGQFYEAECSLYREGKITGIYRQFMNLPGIAANLLLDGFPLELIDGDASNIPLQWVDDVLTELNSKVGRQCRMIVITVLGVQSTGKSTLLNTMFGLQFSVSSGRCTRGAFMLLMKVKEHQREELGCDFILIIDTEGLKAPELTTLEGSYEHDNELATLVVGLSDITIVNMAMENATEMKDILQIVVHAFLRMGTIGKKPNCQFVHQNISDISAHSQNMRDRKHLLEQLNAMTKAAAKMEKQNENMTFSDIMEYDPDKHNWYIPGLWHGVPPMAPVNVGYSENVQDFKKYLFQFIRERRIQGKATLDIPQFKEWIQSLWKAVKHENFIFSFRNSLVAEAYNQLSMKFSEWEWAFRKEMHLWVAKKETEIQNQSKEELNNNTQNTFKHESFQKHLSGEKAMLDSLQKYFESGIENLNFVERYKEDFKMSVKSLRNELEGYSLRRWDEAISIQKGKRKLKDLQEVYTITMEENVVRLLHDCRNRDAQLGDEELGREFAKMWEQTLSELQLSPLEKQQVHENMSLVLQKDFCTCSVPANLWDKTGLNLLNHGKGTFNVEKEHFDLPWYRSVKGLKEIIFHECWYKAKYLVKSLVDECHRFTTDKEQSKLDYSETYCRELLNIVNKCLQDPATSKLHTTARFQVDLKLHILGIAAPYFQRMHEDFISENDPLLRLGTFKAQYLSAFKDLYLQKDECQKRARDFCVLCLKPALMEHIYKNLGPEVVDDILSSGRSKEYSSRMFFQFTLLDNLLKENNFRNYVEYINNYECFVRVDMEPHVTPLQSREHIGVIGKKYPTERDILSSFKDCDIKKTFSRLTLKPQDELFKKVFGCGKQCRSVKPPVRLEVRHTPNTSQPSIDRRD
ncbi:hypothetical protein NDU88_004458 [Pleurodeles waltl]|uniref:VLIG-type G domain-containing protein n=1 Tax=Pleurodeles waltl TaxID=8319 RepID=A0AAV7PD19_PLEWA|nr:hypothetical protein NDU88_004458 [Pleurodeles waltl]